jgi:hypothetical protein
MTTITFHPYAPGITDSAGNRLGSIDPRLSRTNYFDGQLLKASDLTRDQIYLDERLLEMGQVLGSGIAQGLEVELVDNHILRLQPGIAVAPSGRVLQLSGTTLEINLQDSGFIADLNKGRYRRFSRGLYAIALKYAEVVDGVTEAYPADLASRRSWQVSSYAEGVELALIPLNIDLPRGDGVAIRAALAQQIIGRGSRFDLPTDEAIALGLIAIDQARPLWLDLGLLRRPLRRVNTSNALQLDLATHYEELFQAVIKSRSEHGQHGDFAASSYFRLLPPIGPIPKAAIDPVNGRQSYFPKDYEVAIAPVRRADLESIKAESALLAPLDLERDADADIMVLVPMSDQAFALRARQLERSPLLQKVAFNKLPFFNSLALRLFSQPPAHQIDTDAEAWKAIWNEMNPDELVYVRRPPRTAETNVSAVVLARGFKLPDALEGLPLDPMMLESQLDSALEESVEAKQKLEQKEAAVVALGKEIDALLKEIEKLKQSLGSDTQLLDALAQIQTLEAELSAAQEEIKLLTASKGDAAIFKTALEAATDKIIKLTAELELAYKKITALESSGAAIDTDTQKKVEELVAALNEANSKVATLTSERDKAQINLADAELKLEKISAELEALKKKLDELNSGSTASDADLTAAKDEIAKLKQEIELLTKQQQKLQDELAKAQAAQAAAESDAKTAMLKMADAVNLLQAAQEQIKAQTIDLTKYKDLVTSLQTQLGAAEKRITELQFQLAQRTSLSTALPLVDLAAIRGGDPAAAEKLEAQVGDNNDARLAVVHLLTLTPTAADKLLWPSLVTVAQKPANLIPLRDQIVKLLSQGAKVGESYAKVGSQLGMTAIETRSWGALGI